MRGGGQQERFLDYISLNIQIIVKEMKFYDFIDYFEISFSRSFLRLFSLTFFFFRFVYCLSTYTRFSHMVNTSIEFKSNTEKYNVVVYI